MRPRWMGSLLVVAALAGCGGSNASPSPTAAPKRTPVARTDVAAVAARADVPVLCYHQIRPLRALDSASARPYIVSTGELARQMKAIADAGYHTVRGEQLVAHVARGAPLPSKPVLLTFDDASAGQFSHVLPVLRRHHFVATFFVMTVVLDKPGWLTRRQVRALDRAGMTIGGHTWDHRAVPRYSGSDWRTQIDEPAHELRTLLRPPGPSGAASWGARCGCSLIPSASGTRRRSSTCGVRASSPPSSSPARWIAGIRCGTSGASSSLNGADAACCARSGATSDDGHTPGMTHAHAKDLTTEAPRALDAELEGYAWLPRML